MAGGPVLSMHECNARARLLQELTMNRRIACAALILGALSVAMPRSSDAHEGHVHQILGTVTMAAPDHVMLKDKSGKDVTVHIDASTKVRRAGKPARVADITNGTRIAVGAVVVKEKAADRWMARTIDLPAAQAK